MPLPILHPLTKTSIEMRRQMQRLRIHLKNNPDDTVVKEIVEGIETLYDKIPDEVRNPDSNVTK
jgi:hypothetical protein